MSKAFTKETDNDDEQDDVAAEESAHAQLAGMKNYITPSGLQRLKDEHKFLLTRERPAVTGVVAWAAGNGDRSENADYLYGKRRLRQIDSRIRFLTKRIDEGGAGRYRRSARAGWNGDVGDPRREVRTHRR
jgi:transcription elongation factor GreB